MSLARGKATAVALFLVAFLLWRAGASVRMVVEELRAVPAGDWGAALRASEDERIRLWFERTERAAGLPLGYQYELYDVLRRHVPREGSLTILSQASLPVGVAFPRLYGLLYPRPFYLMPELRAGWPASPEDLDERIFVIEYGPDRGRPLERWFERVEEGESWTLWRCRGPEG